MKLLKSLLALVMLVVMTTSCEKDSNSLLHDNYMELEYVGCFNYLNKKSVNQGVISTGTTYKFRWRADFTADVYIKNAKFSVNMPNGIDIDIEGLTWKNVDGVKTISAKDVVPTKVTFNGKEVDASEYVIDAFNLDVFERRLMNGPLTYIPNINMSMEKGDIEVVTVQKQKVYFGSTGVTNNAESTNFTSKTPYYAVTLNPETMEAVIDVYGARFAEAMLAVNMKFDGISFEVSNLGYTLSCEELIPTINENGVAVPYPQYAITNLRGNATFAKGLDLQFDCIGKFAVRANLGYALPAEE